MTNKKAETTKKEQSNDSREELPLQAGHYRTLIRLMRECCDQELYELQDLVRKKDFDGAYKISMEIDSTEGWIERFMEELPEGQPPNAHLNKPKTETPEDK